MSPSKLFLVLLTLLSCHPTASDPVVTETTPCVSTDADADGFPASIECDPTIPADCDDADARFYPGAPESDCYDPADYNCDGATGFMDLDADGSPACEDCDDADAAVHPGAEEACDGEEDLDCDGSGGGDDADGDGVLGCEDCDDGDPAVHPDAAEDCATSEDDDCDGATDAEDALGCADWYADADQDGYGSGSPTCLCAATDALPATAADDCDDADATVNPGAEELCNGLDDDCDGDTDTTASDFATWYLDADGDGHGDASTTTDACEAPTDHVADDADCDDADAATSPSAAEDCDALDNDCSGLADDNGACPCDVDHDGDRPYQVCTTALAWSDAVTACAASGYQLVTVGDASENAWIVAATTSSSSGEWWIGLSDLAVEGTWAWASGESFVYTNWGSGEPNSSGDEDCVSIGRYGDGTWNDTDCAVAWPYVCEVP